MSGGDVCGVQFFWRDSSADCRRREFAQRQERVAVCSAAPQFSPPCLSLKAYQSCSLRAVPPQTPVGSAFCSAAKTLSDISLGEHGREG